MSVCANGAPICYQWKKLTATMLQSFRNVFKTKFGVAFTLAFLALIAVAFASGDVASNATFGGIAGGDNVASVGGEKVGSAEFSQAMTGALDNVRQQNPTESMASLIEQGAMDDVLNQLIDRKALSQFANSIGLRAGDNLVNSEIRRIPAFAGPNGEFDEALYRQMLAQRKLTDQQVRTDLAQGLLAEQVLVPAAFGAKMPSKIAARYAALIKERRTGSVAILPSDLFAPKGKPTEKQLTAYYEANKKDFIRPERRILRYAVFGDEALGNVEPTEAEIKARYEKNKASMYAGGEQRKLTQLIVPTQQAAEDIRKKVDAGGSLEQSARQAGFEVSHVDAIDREDLASQASDAVAKAVFSAPRGKIAAPARGSLGWYVVRVDEVKTIPSRSLDQVRGEIATTLRDEKRAQALSEMSSDIEDRFDSGESLSDVAKTLKAEVKSTPSLVADGRVYGGTPGDMAPEMIRPVLQTAFEMDEGQPQIAATADHSGYIIFETSQITESAAAPMKEITDDLTLAWRASEGSKAAKAAATRVLDRVKKGQSLQAAISAEKIKLPAVDDLNLTREELAKAGQRVPPPLALMFSMAKGTTKKLEGPNNAGWFVVSLKEIEPGKIDAKDPQIAAAQQTLGQMLGREYADSLRAAIRADMKVERNQKAIDAVRKQLTGANNAN